MPWLSDLKRAFQKLGEPEKPRALRRPATGITALYGIGSATTPATINDISITGIYLLTEERPDIGEMITLNLRAEGDPERSTELQFTVHAQVTTHGEDGIGLSFVLPPGLDLGLWIVLQRNLVDLSDPIHVAEAFRSLRMILFVCRLCGPGAEEAIALLGGQLDGEHMATLFNIAFAAENQIDAGPEGGRMRAHPKLVAKILRDGAWAPDELILKMWTGLFVSSCSVDEPDDSNEALADLMVHLTTTECKIFDYACKRARSAIPGGEGSAVSSIILTPEEMVKVTRVYDPYRNATDLAYLFNLGLVQNVFDFTSYHGVDSFDVTPSALGLELYKHSHGTRGKLEPAIVESAKEHLVNFLPPPQPAAAAPADAAPAAVQPAVAAESAVAEAIAAEGAVAEPATAEPTIAEAGGAEPAATESGATAPSAELEAVQPAGVESVTREIASVEPAAGEPVTAEPGAVEAAVPAVEAVAAESATTEASADSPAAQSGGTEPVATEPALIEPAAAEPAAIDVQTPPTQPPSSDS